MARARVYRPDQPCPRCGSHGLPKDGKSQGKPTYVENTRPRAGFGVLSSNAMTTHKGWPCDPAD